MRPLTRLFLFSRLLGYSWSLAFPHQFRISLLISTKGPAEILTQNALELWMKLKSIAITTLNPPRHEHTIFPFISPSFILSKMFCCFQSSSFAFHVEFIPKYFIFIFWFDHNEILFVILLPECLLLECRYTKEFCILLLYRVWQR